MRRCERVGELETKVKDKSVGSVNYNKCRPSEHTLHGYSHWPLFMGHIVHSNTGSVVWNVKRLSLDSNGSGGRKVYFPKVLYLEWGEVGV